MQFSRKSKAKAEIPTASLPDIIFMLLIFFMVATVFKEFRGLPIQIPSAKKTEKLESKRNVTYVWVGRQGQISIDDKIVMIEDVSPILADKFSQNRRLIVSLKIDKEVKMGVVSDLHEKLRDAYTLRINYATKFSSR